jgi:hypothetical protein
MTRKSAARQARDAAAERMGVHLKTNTCWDEVTAIYGDCVAMLMQNMGVVQVGRNEGLIVAVDDKATLAQNLRLLAQDLRIMNEELVKISERHQGKTGGGKTPDEMMESIQVYEMYAMWLQKYDTVVNPTVLHICEIYDLAEQRLGSALAQSASTDPSVITDVEVKETVVEVKEVATGSMLDSVSEQPGAAGQ